MRVDVTCRCCPGILGRVDEREVPLSDWHEAELLPYLALLGSVAVDSARLEWGLAGLYAMLAPGRSMPEALGLAHDRLARKIRRDVGEGVDEGASVGSTDETFAGAVVYWASTASALLARRGRLMHSAWIVGRGAEGAEANVYTHHNRSGKQDQRSVNEMTEFAEELHGHMSNYPAVWAAAMLVAGIRSPDEPVAGDDSMSAADRPGDVPRAPNR